MDADWRHWRDAVRHDGRRGDDNWDDDVLVLRSHTDMPTLWVQWRRASHARSTDGRCSGGGWQRTCRRTLQDHCDNCWQQRRMTVTANNWAGTKWTETVLRWPPRPIAELWRFSWCRLRTQDHQVEYVPKWLPANLQLVKKTLIVVQCQKQLPLVRRFNIWTAQNPAGYVSSCHTLKSASRCVRQMTLSYRNKLKIYCK